MGDRERVDDDLRQAQLRPKGGEESTRFWGETRIGEDPAAAQDLCSEDANESGKDVYANLYLKKGMESKISCRYLLHSIFYKYSVSLFQRALERVWCNELIYREYEE